MKVGESGKNFIGGLKLAGIGAWSFGDRVLSSTVLLVLQLRLGALTSLHTLVNCHGISLTESKFFIKNGDLGYLPNVLIVLRVRSIQSIDSRVQVVSMLEFELGKIVLEHDATLVCQRRRAKLGLP